MLQDVNPFGGHLGWVRTNTKIGMKEISSCKWFKFVFIINKVQCIPTIFMFV